MNRDRVFDVAARAVEKLVEREGAETTFPFDKIWHYADEEVPSVLKPAQQRRLLRDGYIEKTGGMINASTQARAGSPTLEYRPGFHFRPDSRPTLFSSSEPGAKKSVTEILRNIEETMAASGFMVTAEQLANFYLALKSSPLVILAGTSGTGKSRLPRLFAERVVAHFTRISVQPQWSDNADLFGYTPSLAPDTFVEGKFTEAVAMASKQPEEPAIVLLDEMNLAAVEHYFSDFLSVVETRRRQKDGSITTDSLPLDLPKPKEPDPYSHLRNLPLPSNIRVIGTANMDETTRVFSPKVLDRAFSIEFGEVDLTAFIEPSGEEMTARPEFSWLGKHMIDLQNPVAVSEVYPSARDLFDRVAGLAEEIKGILKPAGISFGYRTRDAICLYMWHWERDELADILSLKDALDLCILQKILPKISGTGEGLRVALERLQKWLLTAETAEQVAAALPSEEFREEAELLPREEDIDLSVPGVLSSPYQRSAEKVGWMLQKLSDEGAVTFWGS